MTHYDSPHCLAAKKTLCVCLTVRPPRLCYNSIYVVIVQENIIKIQAISIYLSTSLETQKKMNTLFYGQINV